MAEATDRAMWFGVEDGVMRYDGASWTAYTEENGILGKAVQALCATRDGSVYAGTRMGISRFQGGTWRRVFPVGIDFPWHIYDLMEASDGRIWAGTGWGALRLEREERTLFSVKQMAGVPQVLASGVHVSIVPDHAAPMHAWPEGIGAAVVWESHQWDAPICALEPDGPAEAAGLKVGDRITAVDGQPLVTGNRLNGSSGASVRLTVQREGRPEPLEVSITREQGHGSFQDFSVYDVFQDEAGMFWFGLVEGVDDAQIVRYDPAKSSGQDMDRVRSGDATAWRLYGEEDGLDIGYRLQIAQTRDGALWAVSDHGGRGVNRLEPATWTGKKSWTSFLLSALGGVDYNWSILETQDGALWIGGGFGHLHACRNGVWAIYKAPTLPVPTDRIRSLMQASDGAVWMAEDQGAVRLDPGAHRWCTYEGLSFQCEAPSGSQWFLADGGGVVVRHRDARWQRYGAEDGLMDRLAAVFVTREGQVWAVGSQEGSAVTAQFKGERWVLQPHPGFARWIMSGAVYEASDGSIWLGAGIVEPEQGDRGGVLRFGPTPGKSERTWTHYLPPDAPFSLTFGIGQTTDGSMWFGGTGAPPVLRRFDGEAWHCVTHPHAPSEAVDVLHTIPEGGLWAGARGRGLFHFDPIRQDGIAWTRYDAADGLAGARTASILRTEDGSVWVAATRGISRFDGRTWTTQAISPDVLGSTPVVSLRQSPDGAIWINMQGRTVRYMPDADPPDTEITVSLDRVSQPGNTPVSWHGADPWRVTLEEDLQYSWRLDGGTWSPYSPKTSYIFLALPGGDHTFEVRARDQDFNVDATPAVAHFTVVPPVWRQRWFVGMVALFVTGIGVQTGRVVRRGKRLREANAELEQRVAERTVELSKTNRSLLTLSECNQVLVRAEDETELIREVCRILVEIGEYRLAWVGYAEQDEEKTVRPAGHWGHEAGYLDTLDVTWADTEAGGGPTGVAVRTGETVVVQDIETNPRYGPWRSGAQSRGYASSIGLPLRAGEQVSGVLRIYAGEANAFGPDEVRLLEELAGDLAYGIVALKAREDLRRAEQELRKHRERLEERVAERTAELEAKNAEMERLNRLFVGRELRIKELRDRVKELEERMQG